MSAPKIGRWTLVPDEPWIVLDDDDFLPPIRVATVHQTGDDDENSRLIAAAPDMLELLRAAHPHETHQHVDALTCWLCKVKRLLARIDGKEGT